MGASRTIHPGRRCSIGVEITGHAGAGALAPANTIASFAAAVAVGVDRIEFDVSRDGDAIVIAHDLDATHERLPLSLGEGLDFLASTGLPLSCDLKVPGVEIAVAAALSRRDLLQRTIVCSHDLASLRMVQQALEGEGLIGWSVPQPPDTMGQQVPWPAERAARLGWRAQLPRVAGRALKSGPADGIMCHYLLVTAALASEVHRLGGWLTAWTVDEPGVAQRVARDGVDGITSNDPAMIRRALGLTSAS